MRQWALERWRENAQVALADELPMLKAENRMMRERAEDAALAAAMHHAIYDDDQGRNS